MVQEWGKDYYELLSYGNGCCLKCSNAHDGCLCYDCKCKKCYWYISPANWDGVKGKCGVVLKKINSRKVVPLPAELKNRHFDTKKLIIKPMDFLKEVTESGGG